MKLSIVILCWNDRAVISDCLRSIYATTRRKEFEVIVSDNGSSDGSPEFIRNNYPQVQVIENNRNLRFAKANNVGIRACRGDYVLILNPDTIIHEGTLDTLLRFADQHVEAAAFGCRVLNADGSYQVSARPFASIRREWITAFYLRWLGHLSDWFLSDSYIGWAGLSTRAVDWITGCFMLIRADVLKQLGGFDEQFFYYYEDMDLCRRLRRSGHTILFTPDVRITHLKGQSTNQRLPPVAFALDSQITRYLYYYKYEGKTGVRRARSVALVSLLLRRAGYTVAQLARPMESRRRRLDLLHLLFQWHFRIDPVRLVENGEEPNLGTPVPGRVLER
jgi:GT2 family glycosyltransferase